MPFMRIMDCRPIRAVGVITVSTSVQCWVFICTRFISICRFHQARAWKRWPGTARYQAFSAILGAGDVLLTAHHADDQVETVLLQLLRGAGVSGLAGMPAIKPWHQGWLARPLLPFSRLELEQYALDNGLHWMEDQSNQDVRFSRNLLRQRVVPEAENPLARIAQDHCPQRGALRQRCKTGG